MDYPPFTNITLIEPTGSVITVLLSVKRVVLQNSHDGVWYMHIQVAPQKQNLDLYQNMI